MIILNALDKVLHIWSFINVLKVVNTYNNCGSEKSMWCLSVSLQRGVFLRVFHVAYTVEAVIKNGQYMIID